MDDERLTKMIFKYIMGLKLTCKCVEEVKKDAEEVGITLEMIHNRRDMSMTGSLMPFDNNNDVNSSKSNKSKSSSSNKVSKPQIQPKQSTTCGGNVSGSGGSNMGGSSSSLGAGSGYSSRRKRPCFRAHLNSLWSVWYGLCGAGLQAYVAVLSAERFLAVANKLPRLEVHAYLALTGAAVLLLPFFLTAAVFKIGNLANDGFKLGRHMSTCSADPPGVLLGAGNGVIRSLWQHGGPTAPFLHLTTAFFLLLPKLLMEARLIQSGHLPQDDVWRTDLDFMMVHSDRLVVLSFMTNGSSPLLTPLPSSASSVAPSPASSASPTASSNSTTGSAHSGSGNATVSTLALLGEPDETVELRSADWGPVSAEFLNYALALLVYTVRYPSVFWHTNKAFAALFSFQLLANGMQSLVAYAGLCVLYKVQVLGAKEALPMLHCRMNQNAEGGSPFLLNTHVTLALFVLSNVLVLASSLVLYLYGYGRFSAFLDQERERRVIVLRHTRSGGGWGYFTHCAALCVLLAIAVCNAPLLYDYTVVYRCSLDGAVLASVIGAIMHLFFWVLLWLILTVKQRWSFKLRVTVGRAAVKSARSIKLVTDVDLVSAHHCDNGTAPLLVVGNGRTYTIADTSPKKAIMSVIQKTALERKAKAAQDSNDDGEEQIYWLRPKPPSPKTSPDSTSDRLTWLNRKLSSNSGGTKHKVTFDDSLGSSGSRKGKSLLSKSPKSGGKGKNKHHPRGLDQLSESEDDGDYATLRELPLMGSIPSQSEDTASEDNKLLEHDMSDDNVTYAHTNKDSPPVEYGDPSPPLTPQPTEDLPPPVTAPVTVTVHNSSLTGDAHQFQGSVTPRCLRRADSGMPHEELTPRSDSVSTESSGSGGSPPCGNHSETSSGVHSNSSSENHNNQLQSVSEQDPTNAGRKSTSVDDLTTSLEQPRVQPPWRSFSLQRNVMPPTSTSPAVINPLKNSYGAQSSCVQYNGPVNKPSSNSVAATAAAPSSSTSTKEMPPPNGCPAVLLESATESTVVIRRKQSRPKTTDGNPQLVMKDEPFGRSTNMRMTSFTDDGSRPTVGEAFPSSSSTLPHYPTQPIPVTAVYPHCSTMPLPSSSSGMVSSVGAVHPGNNSAASTSCNSFQRPHTTIPTHHNGVRLFAGPNPFVKRFPPYHHQGGMLNGRPPQVVLAPVGTYGTMPASSTTGNDMVQGSNLTGHHTFPHITPTVKYNPQQHLHKQERDSANFSMASSGDSDQYLPHNT
ncbi:protein tincar [Anabrus simplex]|uniref:protein tincar n=1 Tax=Anabrus simplex TaxID=316456 RepID=UPI0035A27E82